MQGMAGSGCSQHSPGRESPLLICRLCLDAGTRFLFLPESLLRMALPVGLKFVLPFIFRAAKEYPDACEATRIDIDRKLSAALKEWREE